MLLGNDGDYNFSVHHNFFAHNSDRNPEIKAKTGGIVDVVNNVSYNYGWSNTIISDKYGIPYINYVGNSTIQGPNSSIKENKPITAYGVHFYDYTEPMTKLVVMVRSCTWQTISGQIDLIIRLLKMPSWILEQ